MVLYIHLLKILWNESSTYFSWWFSSSCSRWHSITARFTDSSWIMLFPWDMLSYSLIWHSHGKFSDSYDSWVSYWDIFSGRNGGKSSTWIKSTISINQLYQHEKDAQGKMKNRVRIPFDFRYFLDILSSPAQAQWKNSSLQNKAYFDSLLVAEFHIFLIFARVAQWKSSSLLSWRSQVRSLSRAP